MLAVVGILAGSFALLLYEGAVVVMAVIDTLDEGGVSSKTAKVLAVGLIEAIDIFLIAIVANMIGQGLYKLFVDPGHTLPSWLQIRDMDDLKSHLASSVIAVLAVLFLREAVAWDGQRNLLQLGAAIALIIAVLTLYLVAKKRPD
jgi:uncharacterized membrane protein YqhA